MQRRQSPADVQPQPEQGLELRVGQVRVEVAGDVEERLLEHVRGIEPGPKPRVHAQLDHPPEPIAMVVEQLRQRLGVAGAKPFDPVCRVVGVWSMSVPILLIREQRPERDREVEKISLYSGSR